MEALYFPRLSLPGAAWVNPNLLYFDRINVIAPLGNRAALFDGPTRALIDSDLVCPLDPERYARDDNADAMVISHLLGMAQTRHVASDIQRIHLGKIAHTEFMSELIALRLLWHSYDSEWLEGPGWVVDYIMSVLATRMAFHRDLNLSLVTNHSFAKRLVTGDALNPPTILERRRVAVSRLLPIGPDAGINDIIAFRERHAEDLRRFREFVERLVIRSREDPDGDFDFEHRLSEAERLRTHLVGELQTIRFEVKPIELILSLSGIAAPIIEHAPYSTTSAIAGLGYLIWKAASAHRRRREIASDKLVYAALTAQDFAAKSAEDVLA